MTKKSFFALAIFLAGVFVFANSSKILTHPDRKLNDDEYDIFILGRSFFKIPWIEAPSATTARDGLGPLFNANTCTSCHPRNGRGEGRNEHGQLDRSMIVKLASKPKTKEDREILKKHGVLGDKIYGTQLQNRGVYDVPYEAQPHIENEKKIITYKDGKQVELERPILSLTNLQYGKMDKDTSFTLRLAQPLIGMGLIDLIDERDILLYEDEFDKNKDGISGKANYVYSHEYKKIMLGRFNWKASTPTAKEQSALAFHDDMGISNYIYPSLPCTKNQKQCLDAPKSKHELDITPLRLEAVNFYVSNLKVPKSTITQTKGQELFSQIGCASCHRPSYNVAGNRTIYPYSDFLLHDLGEDLADKRGNFKAKGNEWRTQPLWGLKYAKTILKKDPRYLHDARARSLEEAILWHGGEASNSRKKFMELDKEDRQRVIKFLKEL